jgi:DNA (cytosine-5)-methyltransferase 1
MKYKSKRKIDDQWLLREEQHIYDCRTVDKLSRKRKRFRLIDTFSGAGGMSLGFSKSFGHAFDTVWANDFNLDSVETYNANFGGHCLHGNIVEILKDSVVKIPEANVVIGGPPCQGFSLLNKKREDDPRKQLWRPFFEIVERSGAEIFVMENVPQILGSLEYREIKNAAEAMEFIVRGSVLCAADYGVPQTRRRAIIIGCKKIDPATVFPPRKTHFNTNGNGKQLTIPFNQSDFLVEPQKWKTVRDAISDLPPPEGTEIKNIPAPLDLHFGRNPTELSRKRYRAIPKEGMNRFDLQRIVPELTPKCWIKKKSGGTDLFGRLWWDRPSFTIRTEFFKPEKGRYLHPEQHRPITHREAARLQSFPDDFIFKGSKIEIAKQIGNAVPPSLAARVADVVYLLLTAIKR